jgi:hypothetical protein
VFSPPGKFTRRKGGNGVGINIARAARDLCGDLGRAVQIDPMKPMLKPPRTKRLKLKCDILLSSYSFKFNLRRYTSASPRSH